MYSLWINTKLNVIMAIFLDGPALTATTGIIGDYKINWRLNSTTGEIVFVSGVGNDPTLQVQHPFINEVVQSGTLYPTIEYIFIDGNRITSELEEDVLYSPELLSCLSPVIIDNITCDTILNNNSTYSFQLSYNNTTSVQQNKNRIFNYYIDATANYLAWGFQAGIIADGLKLYYCTTANPSGVLIENYITGRDSTFGVSLDLLTDLEPIDYPNNPKIVPFITILNFFPLRQVTDLTSFAYTSGDFIRVEIIGSVYDPTNNNTNWTFSCTCLNTFSKTFNNLAFSELDNTFTPTISFNLGLDVFTNCTYQVNYKVNAVAQNTNNLATIDMTKYLSLQAIQRSRTGGTSSTSDLKSDEVKFENSWSTQLTLNLLTTSDPSLNNACVQIAGGGRQIVEKTVGNLEITYPDLTSYTRNKDRILVIESTQAVIDARNSDPLIDISYYSAIWVDISTFSEQCGDVGNIVTYRFTIHSTFTFDDVNLKISMLIPEITYQLSASPDPCTGFAAILARVNNMNSTRQVVLSTNTGTMPFANFHNAYLDGFLSVEITSDYFLYYYLPEKLYDHLFTPAELSTLGFCLESPPQVPINRWVLFKAYDKLTFTDPTSNASRLGKWTLERQRRLETHNCADTMFDLVYTNNTDVIFADVEGTSVVTGNLQNSV